MIMHPQLSLADGGLHFYSSIGEPRDYELPD